MSSHFFKSVNGTIKHWYLPLIAGLILIAMGIWTFREPIASYMALAFLFSLSFIIAGLFDTIFSISNREVIDNWGWSLAKGIFTLIVGVLMIKHPVITMATLPLFIGLVVLNHAMSAISFSFDLKNYGVSNWNKLLALGIIGVLVAIILILNPDFAGLSIVAWTGIALIIAGVVNLIISFKLKKLHDLPGKISSDLMGKFEQIKSEIKQELAK
jgi:hypothetical protein